MALTGCLSNNPWQHQRDYLKSVTPPALAQSPAAPAPSQPARKLTVRVWVDGDYRGQTPNWESHVRSMLDRASEFMRGPFGVELVPVAITAWDRPGAASKLEPVLAQLAEQDKGEDVDFVIGLVSSLTAFTATYHELGMSNLPGRHLVLRGIDNAQETDVIVGSLKLLGDDEKLPVVRARKQHKETAVLLHEWAHALGAFHDRDVDNLMATSYASGHTKFSALSVKVITIGLAHHPKGLSDGPERKAWIAELQPIVDALADNQWAMGEREKYLAWMEERHVSDRPLAGADAKLLELAVDKVNAGRAADALATARPLAERFPREERVQSVTCWAAERAGAPDAADVCRKACDEAQALFACLRVAEAELAAGEDVKARARLRALEPKVHERDGWTQLAQMYRRASCPTWAEQASAHAEMSAEAGEIAEWAGRTRRWLGIDGMPPDDEGELLAAFGRVGKQLNAKDLAHAREGIAKLRERFPKSALPKTLQCELLLRGHDTAPARAACEQALAAAPGCGYAHYLTGVLQQTQGHHAEAAKHLETALAIEPDNDDGWDRLIEAYGKSGNAAGVESAKTRRAERHRP